jgi:putative transposase
MANPSSSMDFLGMLRNKLEEAPPDALREIVSSTIQLLMSAEADALCGADYGERSDDRIDSRNGLGVSTRRVETLVQQLGIKGISKSQVSVMAKSLDEEVKAFCDRPLDGGPYTYVWVDALSQRCRENGRVVNVATVIATGVNAEGRREILGVDVFTAEDGAAWTTFLRGLVARGLSGVKLVTSDSHEGLKSVIAAVLPGAVWQRCRVHFIRNLMSRVPKSAQDMVVTLVRSIFAQPDAEAAWAQHGRVCIQLQQRFPAAAELLVGAAEEVLAYTGFPKEHWRQIWCAVDRGCVISSRGSAVLVDQATGAITTLVPAVGNRSVTCAVNPNAVYLR